MAFVDRDELERLKARDQEADRLAHQVAMLQPVGRIAVGVEQELATADTQGYIGTEAEQIAQATVFIEERQALVDELAGQLKVTRRAEFVAKLREQEGPAIRQQLDTQFQSDGTYAQIESDARGSVADQIRAALLGQKRAEIDAELSTDEVRNQMEAEIRTEIEGSDEIARYRNERRASLQGEWHQEVVDAVKAHIDQEEADGEQGFKETYEVQVRASDQMARRRKDVREELERQWRKATTEKVAEAIGNEELQSLLQAKADQEKEKLRKENYARQLITQFTSLGIDVSDVEEGTKVSVLLGHVGDIKIKEQYEDPWHQQQTREVVKPGVLCQRKITFVALGANRFLACDDSLHNSSSVYEQNDSIENGTVVVLGRKLHENGSERIEPRLAANAPFFYDDDTTTPNIVDARLSIADVHINGISALGLSHVKMQSAYAQ